MNEFVHPVKKVVAHVLEEWAMMMVDPASDPLNAFQPDAPLLQAIAKYEGVFHGTLTIICQSSFLDNLAHNVLGIESLDPISEEERWDALREFANIVSGNFLVEAYGDDTVFDLPSFQLQELELESFQALIKGMAGRFLQEATALYLADGEPVFVSFTLSLSNEKE